MTAFVVAIVGAESSGKTELARALQQRLAAGGRTATWVGEALREFCDRQGRTPRRDEQAALAAEQTRRIDDAAAAAAGGAGVVVADTTALMIAVYSDFVFGDASLYPLAEAAHRRCDLTLLTALDLPWQADGLQRDGPHVREPVDALVRAALARVGRPYAVVSGLGPKRLESAWRAVAHALDQPRDAAHVRVRWVCDRCGDPDCERRLLPACLPRR